MDMHLIGLRRVRRAMVSAILGFVATLLVCSSLARCDDWLQWGGPKGDFTVAATGLAEKWPSDGPKILWKRPLGDGYSAILCKGDRLFTAYRDGDNDVVIALDARSGKTIWENRQPYQLWPDMTREFGLGPNSTPLIVGDRIVHVTIDGRLRCLDLDAGKPLWQHDLPGEFGRRKRVEEYGYSGNPLPYRDTIILPVGGDGTGVIAVRPSDGSVVWKSEPCGVSYAPATVTNLLGQDQYVFFTPEGVRALNPGTGVTLWHSDIPFNNGNHLTPIVRCDDAHLWVASQFLTGGARLLSVAKAGGTSPAPNSATLAGGTGSSTPGASGSATTGEKPAASPVAMLPPYVAKEEWFQKKLQASHWTSIRVGDYIYGSIGGNDLSFLSAFEWKTGKIAWRERGFHKAQCLYADEKLLFLDEPGKLTLAKVSPEKLQVLASAPITEAVSWTVPTLVGTKLYARDRKNILALELGRTGSE